MVINSLTNVWHFLFSIFGDLFFIDLWGRKMLCFGWLCPLYAGGLSLPVGGIFADFSMVDSTKFSIEAQIFQKFFIKCLLFKDRNH